MGILHGNSSIVHLNHCCRNQHFH